MAAAEALDLNEAESVMLNCDEPRFVEWVRSSAAGVVDTDPPVVAVAERGSHY